MSAFARPSGYPASSYLSWAPRTIGQSSLSTPT
jgi:hypothetical protein